MNEEYKYSSVRAKFKCVGMEKTLTYNSLNPFAYNYRFQPVTSGSEENKQFFAATPSGEIKLTSVKEELFEVGAEYYLDFLHA